MTTAGTVRAGRRGPAPGGKLVLAVLAIGCLPLGRTSQEARERKAGDHSTTEEERGLTAREAFGAVHHGIETFVAKTTGEALDAAGGLIDAARRATMLLLPEALG
jgi:hypothetical protein